MWHLAYTHYGQEERAQRKLNEQGLECYLPFITFERRDPSGRFRKITEPAFKKYLFIRFDPNTQSAYKINNTPGVVCLVSFHLTLARIPDQVIESIKKTFEHYEHSDRLNPGAKVHIIGGAFAGLDAIFHEHDGDNRSKIMLNLLNKKMLITLDNNLISL